MSGSPSTGVGSALKNALCVFVRAFAQLRQGFAGWPRCGPRNSAFDRGPSRARIQNTEVLSSRNARMVSRDARTTSSTAVLRSSR